MEDCRDVGVRRSRNLRTSWMARLMACSVRELRAGKLTTKTLGRSTIKVRRSKSGDK